MKAKRTRKTVMVDKLVSSTEFHKRKFPKAYDTIVESKEKTLEEKIERKERNKRVKFDSKWENIKKEMNSFKD